MSDLVNETKALDKLGKNIRLVRTYKNLTTKEAARLIGISTASLAKLETGNTKISLTLLKKLAKGLKTGLDVLVFGGDLQNSMKKVADMTVQEKIHLIEQLPEEDKWVALHLFELILAKRKIIDLTNQMHSYHKE